MELSVALPEPGQIARVRQRLYMVERSTPGPSAADSTLVGLSCVDDDAQGQPLEVLWEREIDTEILTAKPGNPLPNGASIKRRFFLLT